MRKFLVSLAVSASALAVATPASAQYYPQPQPYGYEQPPGYGYAQPQGYGYGYNNNYGQVRVLQVRINQIQRQINQLARRNILSNKEARRLRDQSRSLERRLAQVSRNGLNPRERYDMERQIAGLEQRVRYEASDGNRRYGYNGYGQNAYGQNVYGQNPYDRDRDGRDDRYEDDHGTRHDN